jgi:hypothetical protein
MHKGMTPATKRDQVGKVVCAALASLLAVVNLKLLVTVLFLLL